ncbi:MAG: hypothetical protein V7703_11890, partial [Hyphomicrobiales bacterium]
MTSYSRFADVLLASVALGSNRAALAAAAVLCACGLATAGVLITNGTISLDKFRQSVATMGTGQTAGPQLYAPGEEDPATAESESAIAPDVAGTVRVPSQSVISPPTFDIVRVEPDGNAVLAGLSAPNDKIEVISGNQVLARANANAAGEWALVLDEPLPAGGHQIAVHSISSQSDEPLISVQNVTVAVPENAMESAIVMLDQPGQPSAIWQSPATIIRPETPNEAGGLLDLTPPDKAAASHSSTPADENPDEFATTLTDSTTGTKQIDSAVKEPLVTIETIETEGEADLLVSGASRPNASVRLFLDNRLIGETVAGPVGRWHLQTTHTVPEGRLMLRAEQLEHAGGAVVARREVPFERDPEIVGSLAASFDPGKTIDHEIRVDTASGSD